jgi:hypothetical protein
MEYLVCFFHKIFLHTHTHTHTHTKDAPPSLYEKGSVNTYSGEWDDNVEGSTKPVGGHMRPASCELDSGMSYAHGYCTSIFLN